MLLVRDLDPTNWPPLGEKHSFLDHPIVRKIFQGTNEQTSTNSDWGIAAEHDVENGPGARIPLVYDADSSQHSALVDVLDQRKNVVIEGPPGTGKSQTITNLIAASLFDGKRVLFVAEKLAALEVVKARLTRAGLDPFLLELHSNKTNKKRVLEELAKRRDCRFNSPSDLPRKLQELERYRSDLCDYRDLINSVTHNAFGKTLHQIMWRAESYRMALSTDHRPLTQRSIRGAREMSELELGRRMDCLRYLGDQYGRISGFDSNSPFWGFFPDPIIPGEEAQLHQIFLASREWTGRFVQAACDYDATLGDRTLALTLDDATAQLAALDEIIGSADAGLPFDLTPLLFQADKTGLRAQRRLEDFSAQTKRYYALGLVVAQVMRGEDAVTRDRIDTLLDLERTAAQLGAVLETQAEMRDLFCRLQNECERFETALIAINEFCAQNGFPFDGSRSQLALFGKLARTIAEAPEELLHLQRPGLTREGSYQAIEALACLQREWATLASELDPLLYLDARRAAA
jgi:hypothetical protein